jgi:hypothetical protein
MDNEGGGDKIPLSTDLEKNALPSMLPENSSPITNETPMSWKEHKASMDDLQESMMEKFEKMLVEHINKPQGSIAPNPANNASVLIPAVANASKESPTTTENSMPTPRGQIVRDIMLTHHHQAITRPTFTHATNQ